MTKKELPKSVRKYVRREKARIRREFLDSEERRKEIEKLYNKLLEKYSNKK